MTKFIAISIKNALTMEQDLQGNVAMNDYTFEKLQNLQAHLEQVYPDSHVNVSVAGTQDGEIQDFICGQPMNMVHDEIRLNAGLMTWEEYDNKWYNKFLAR